MKLPCRLNELRRLSVIVDHQLIDELTELIDQDVNLPLIAPSLQKQSSITN